MIHYTSNLTLLTILTIKIKKSAPLTYALENNFFFGLTNIAVKFIKLHDDIVQIKYYKPK